MVPPLRPVKALIAAELFMYETGTVDGGRAGLIQRLPGTLDLGGGGHVGHRAAGGEVRQDDCLAVGRQNVGALGHEMHTAEDDVVGFGPGRCGLGELERVAGDVGELDDLVALVVVAEDEHPVSEGRLRGPGTLHERRVGRCRQLAGAFDAAFGVRIRLGAQQEQRLAELAGDANGGVCHVDGHRLSLAIERHRVMV